MICCVEAITEIDLQAYVDGELPIRRRVEVESYLCRHTAEAARIIADLRAGDALRLALAKSPLAPSGATIAAALRLQRGLYRDRIIRSLRRVAGVTIVVGLGW